MLVVRKCKTNQNRASLMESELDTRVKRGKARPYHKEATTLT